MLFGTENECFIFTFSNGALSTFIIKNDGQISAICCDEKEKVFLAKNENSEKSTILCQNLKTGE